MIRGIHCKELLDPEAIIQRVLEGEDPDAIIQERPFSSTPKVGQFRVGQSVRVKLGSQWSLGTVVHPRGSALSAKTGPIRLSHEQHIPVYLHATGGVELIHPSMLQHHGID